jgi:UDP:flavonoid glycosyltransferase YjiC (YdhE family)
MHLVSSHVDLMVHQCGSGTYHYPLLHNVPAITIGTQCYDREEVAVRLEELGASTHIPSPAECDDFVERFKRTVAEHLGESGARLQERRECLSRLKNEIEQTVAAFDFEGLLDRAAGAPKGRGRASGV